MIDASVCLISGENGVSFGEELKVWLVSSGEVFKGAMVVVQAPWVSGAVASDNDGAVGV